MILYSLHVIRRVAETLRHNLEKAALPLVSPFSLEHIPTSYNKFLIFITLLNLIFCECEDFSGLSFLLLYCSMALL